MAQNTSPTYNTTKTVKTLPAVGPGNCSPSVNCKRDRKKKRKKK